MKYCYCAGCADNWFKVGSTCLRLYSVNKLFSVNTAGNKTNMSAVDYPLSSYVGAETVCSNLGGQVTSVDAGLLTLLRIYLDIWNHVNDGDIWIKRNNQFATDECSVIRVRKN